MIEAVSPSRERLTPPALTPPALTPCEPDWLRGTCPRCGEAVISNCYYVEGRGYLVIWECAASLVEQPACSYRRVL
ncbi:MAG TPA: hypothetical protein VFU47_16375 [Armatimonadota bacterium]|nr:hypothetical protein [Armatimonadota bacterium]